MNINFGLIAVKKVGENVEVLHFCGYEKEPTEFDKQDLRRELETDPEFNLIGEVYSIELATQEMIEFYKMRLSMGLVGF